MLVAIARLWAIVFTSLVWANEESDEIHYTNSWAVHVDGDDFNGVNQLADKHGFTNLGQIGSLPGYFHFVKKTIKEKSKRSLDDHTGLLLAEPKVKWVKQQRLLDRSKRNIIPDQEDAEREKRDTAVTIHDPFYKDQWYLQNIGQSSGPAGLDINVLPVWGQGYTGKGIVVSILDDGVDHTHPDLKRNYDPDASFDFNDFDPDPKPRSTDPLNCHGTKCAGEVAAEANNGICGVGVSFNASIGGIRMLDGKATDTIEGSSLSYHSDYIDIYTCCWGPKDDGKRFGKPGFLTSKALKIGAERGRGGKGNIFVWATGNGGLTDDDCNCDGYTTSIYTVSIGAISDHGLSTYYTETCASTLAVTFSGASHREAEENKIITTGLDHKCTKVFKGTSSAAPLASGMLALVLEANPNLTWRDVQHVIVETSQKTSPLDEGWKTNGAGKEYNQKFGFGKLDATRMVEKAKKWENVPKQRVCYSKEHDTLRNIPSSGSLIMSANSSACAGTKSEIRKLEHVQVKVSLEHRRRGQLSVTLISPSGTRSELLKTRRNDHSTAGLKDWIFMTVHCWGEDPRGSWTLIVTDNDRNTREHHVIKAKQGDSEDVTRVVMDDTEKQGPWDANEIKEYGDTETAPPGNHPSQDHILKGMENTMGELVTGNKFTELAKRKKDRHHSAKGFVVKKPNKRHGHAQNRPDDRQTKKGKNWTKKKNLKHSPKTHKHHKQRRHKIHKYTKKFKKKHHNHRRHKDRSRGHGRKPLMAEGSIEIPKDKSPLEAKIAVKALMNPYFKFSTSKIVLPKQYQGFMGEVDIKMKLVKDRDKERKEDGNEQKSLSVQQESRGKTDFPKPQNKSVNMSQLEGVSKVVKQKNQIKNLTHDFGTHSFPVPRKEIKLLEEARQNPELKNTSERTAQKLQDSNRTVNSSNVYANLLNSIQSMRNSDVTNSSTEVYERIDLLTDDKVNNHDNANNSIRIIGRNSTTGSVNPESNLTGSVNPGSNLTGSVNPGSNLTRSFNPGSDLTSDDTGHGLNSVNSSKRNVSENDFKGNSKTISLFDALRNAGNENDAVSPDVPIIFFDAEKNQFAEVRKINKSETMKVQEVTINEVNRTGNEFNGTGNEFNRTGNEFNRTGTEFNRTGNDVNRTGNEVNRTGDEGNRTGDEGNRIGNEVNRIGNEVNRTGDEVNRTGDEGNRIGNEVNSTGNEGNRTGSNIIKNGSNGIEDDNEASGVSGSSGVLIEEKTDCDDDSSLEVKCVTEEMSNGLISQTEEQLDAAAGETTGDDDDGNDNNTDVTDYATGSHEPQGSQDPRKAPRAEMDPSKDKDEGTLAYLLSTERYQDVPSGPSKQVGLIQANESTPLNTSDIKDQVVPERTKMSQEKLQTGIKHQDIPVRPSLTKESSQSQEKRPLYGSDQEEENVPNKPSKKTTDPNNPRTQIDNSNIEPLNRFASKNFAALEHTLEKEVTRLENFKDESSTSSQFLQRVKDDIRDRNVEDLKSLEDEIRNDMNDVLNDRDDGRKDYVDPDMFFVETNGDSDDDMNEDGDDDEELHRLERRRVSKNASKRVLLHNKHSKNNGKYYKGSSGILKSWSLILYGT